jgi:hypothetical protein
MATIAEVRAQYPQYADMPDAALADALHKKFYSDLPKAEFDTKIGLTSVDNRPAWAKENPRAYEVAQTVRKYAGPTVEAATSVAGGVLGAPGGPAGVVGGSALGYGIGKEITNLADIALGNVKQQAPVADVTRAAKNVLEGAAMEAGGQVVAPYIAKAVGKVIDIAEMPMQKAAKMARDAFGPDIELAVNALRNAPKGMSVSQTLADAGIVNPTAQALIQKSLARDPAFVAKLNKLQQEDGVNALSNLVGGTTQTEAKTAQAGAKNALNTALEPVKRNELAVANVAGTTGKQLQTEADRMAMAAANKVDDVRRFTAAEQRAKDMAKGKVAETGLSGTGVYNYPAELAIKADEVATQAAGASLRFGEAAQFKQAAADSLAAYGLKPLESGAVVQKVLNIGKNPEFAGNKDIAVSLGRVADDITAWTNNGGVIDAFALDAIRKNSVNAAIRDLYPTADAKVQKQLAAGVLSRIKPLIVDAIESAGGTGYGKYLDDYAAGANRIAQQKLSAEALDLYKKNPKGFIDLVKGESPDVVENIFGPGNYDIAVQMADDLMKPAAQTQMGVLKETARVPAATIEAEAQASQGQDALRDLLMSHLNKFRLPSYLSAVFSTANKGIQILENAIGQKTMKTLTEGFKSGKGTEELLSTLPAEERTHVIKFLKREFTMPDIKASSAAVAKGVPINMNQNRLTPPEYEQNQNALAR